MKRPLYGWLKQQQDPAKNVPELLKLIEDPGLKAD